MGLLFAESAGGEYEGKSEVALYHKMGCKVCPLAKQPGRMEPTGAAKPVFYFIGEAPGKDEIAEGEQFVGVAGTLLRRYVPRDLIPLIRWNNVVRSRPPKNRTPERIEIECCRPSIVADIERSKPKAIFGFGNVPLQWVSGFTGITYWRGRRMPVQVGKHKCWYYAFLHPSYLHRIARDDGDFGSEDERLTAMDLRRAFAEIDDLPVPEVHTPEMAKANVECITKVSDIDKALRWAADQPEVGVDYETNGIRPYIQGARILTAAVGTLKRAFAFPMFHPGAPHGRTALEDTLELWKRFLLRAPCAKIVHNLAFEMEWSGYFFGHDVLRAQPWEDTANAAAIVDSRKGKKKPGCFSLEFLVQQHFGFNLKKVSNVDGGKLAQTPLETVLLYNGMDAKYHYGIWSKLWPIIKEQRLTGAYDLAVRRVPTLTLSQLRGVPVDQDEVTVLAEKYEKKLTRVYEKIQSLEVVQEFRRKRGYKFGPLSNPDVIYVFDDMLQRPEVHVVDKYSKKDKRSAAEGVLTQIKHPLAKALLELREANGTKSKYIDALREGDPDCVLFPDGLIHAQFNTFFAETGRLSCESPNLQNFPKRDEETKEVRRSIHAQKGEMILSLDYGQIEARVIAMFTHDKRFCKALWENYDVHMEWAERLAFAYPERIGGKKNLADKKVMKTFRTDIKNQWTFPLFFGARDTSVSNYLNIPVEVIRPHYRAFWKQFSGVKQWQEDLLEFYHKHGYVQCLTKRRRHGPFSVNQVYNSPVQGTAAEIVMDAMSRLSETGDPELQPELQIHDDLTFVRVPQKRIDAVAEKVISMMLAVPFKWVNVPITVEMSVGKNWADLQEVATYSSDTWGK
jgi:DNA polymerase I